MNEEKKARFIAYYLPQFHPIPENDIWWGNGFTEWTNVARARPLYPGHYQPHIPADLGFYDLRLPEISIQQAKMAQTYGIEGFLYWHYWFAGKRLLEKPFEVVLSSGQPDFPFCLGWANESWTSIWHGAPNRMLIEQTYPGNKDYELHFESILPALIDERYIRVDNKPLFLIFSPHKLPNSIEFCQCWRNLAKSAGLPGLYLVGISYWTGWIPQIYGFDGSILFNITPVFNFYRDRKRNRIKKLLTNIHKLNDLKLLWLNLVYGPTVISYEEAIKNKIEFPPNIDLYDYFPVVMPNWDNTPRTGKRGLVFEGSTPELFKKHLLQEIEHVRDRPPDKRIIFVKSWNEWAEGNYLEPDLLHGRGNLEMICDVLNDR